MGRLRGLSAVGSTGGGVRRSPRLCGGRGLWIRGSLTICNLLGVLGMHLRLVSEDSLI